MRSARPTFGNFLARGGEEDGQGELYIYDQIGASLFREGVTAKQVVAALDKFKAQGKETLCVYINSPGGSVFEGVAILNAIRRFEGRKIVCVDGLAASAASIVVMGGDEIRMGSGAMMMVHNPSGGAGGTAVQLRDQADALDKIAEAMVGAYQRRTKLEASEIQKIMDAETWMTAADAVARGFADQVDEDLDPDEEAKARAHQFYASVSPIFATYRNTPQALRAQRPQPPAGAPGTQESAPMKVLLAKLGLSESATEAQAVAALETVGTSRAKLIEITGAATEAEALGTLHAWKASHGKVKELSEEVARLAAATAEAQVVPLVDGAIKEGKAAPAQRESLLAMGRSNPEMLKAFIAAAPVIHGKGPIAPRAENDSVTLTAEEIEVAKKMNVPEAKFLEGKRKAIADGRAPNAGVLAYLAMAPA